MENHKRKPWHSMPIAEVFSELGTSEEGLSDAEAADRLKRYGSNELRKKPPKTLFQLIWAQIADAMVIILLIAAALSFILGEITEGVVLLIIVVVNAIVGVVQEGKAEAALESLKQMSAPTARVLRQNGEEDVIPASELVVGDIVILEDGAKVPADLRLFDSSSLKIQEASLTGESVPAEKDAEEILPADCALGDRVNMAYSSSMVAYGRATGVVVATGMDTEVGNIANLLDEQDDTDTPLKRKLGAVGKTLAVVGLIICVLIFIIGLLHGNELLPLFMMAISLAVSVIPEGLPATATIVLALGVQRMAKRNALVRKLPAVETLGSTTVICSDKTGTLTMNKMTVTHMAKVEDIQAQKAAPVSEINIMGDDAYREILRAGVLCNNAAFDPDEPDVILGDPTEGAFLLLTRDNGKDPEVVEDENPREFEQPFDSVRKRMTTANRTPEGLMAYCKGAVESVVPQCTHIQVGGEIRPITAEDVELINKMNAQMAANALRLLAIAKKTLDHVPEEEEDVEHDLVFMGLVGMIDPPRVEVKDAIQTCHGAGIRTVMITGDHKITAVAIAKELSIWRDGDMAITGEELDRMSDEQLDQVVGKTSVFARVSPKDKLRIIQSLKRKGEIAAMTGDGVNDAPALKAADIGVAMGITGTDVAKEAADMVLLDDNFTTIVAAAAEGRRVYRNIQKVIQFLLAGNVGEIITVFIATLLNWQAPVLAIHILWVNLATDSLPALALGVDPPEKDLMKQQPIRSGSLFDRGLVSRVIIHGIFISAATLIAYGYGNLGDSHIVGQTMAFCVLAFSQLVHALNQRSNIHSAFTAHNGHNKALFGAMIFSLVLMAILLFIPALRSVFSLTTLNLTEWIIVGVCSFLPLIGVEIMKAIQRSMLKSKAAK